MAQSNGTASTQDAQPYSDTAVDLSSLHDRLDSLWARYLGHLDAYQTAQNGLQKSMASGFFSLAQANFKSTGRRYGRDYYDERMKATRYCHFDSDGDATAQCSMVHSSATASPESKDGKKQTQQPSPPVTPEPEAHAEDQSSPEAGVDSEEKHDPEPKTKSPPNPLQWYGVLVPPQLRSAQSSFVKAVESPVVQAVNATRSMREVEVEIGRTRKLIRKAEKVAA